jgi:very-short-patch-repair endonuclease
MTPAERILWDRVRGRQWRGLKFRRQQIMHGFVADFFCEDARLVIEVDGGIHNSVEQKELDVHRQELFRLHGVRTIRLRNEEIETDIEAALSKVEAALPDAIPGSPSPPTPGALP